MGCEFFEEGKSVLGCPVSVDHSSEVLVVVRIVLSQQTCLAQDKNLYPCLRA